MKTIAVDFIKRAEGLRLDAYQDGAGVWTIGYGHTGPDVVPGISINEDQAETMLTNDMAWAVSEVKNGVKVAMTPEQEAALVSLTFNIGAGAFRKSTVLRRINAGNYTGAADAILMWNKITVGGKKVVSKGLAKRRTRERDLFLEVSTTGTEIAGGEGNAIL